MICLSFFTGAMGMDLGLEQAGIEVILASEIDKASRQTIIENRPNIKLIGDIREFTAKANSPYCRSQLLRGY